MTQFSLKHALGYTQIIIENQFDFRTFLSSISALKIALVDENLHRILLKHNSGFLENFDSVILIPEGENSKSMDQYISVVDQLFKLNADRSTYLFAIGGGVTGDLTGFVAATFMRGISYVQIPTTLLSQIDSSIGGKTGINHPSGKNLLGSIYQPSHILIDPNFLKTLPEREVISALGEMVKYSLLNSTEMFFDLKKYLSEHSPTDLLDSDFKKLIGWIKYCVKIKTKIVEADEREKNIRALLNLGHTFGHAIEKHYGYENIRHGEAVSTGMIFASFLSMKLNKLAERDFYEIHDCLKPILPHQPFTKKWNEEKILSYLQKDKKNSSGTMKWILPTKIGECEIVQHKDQQFIQSAIREFHQQFLKWE